MTDYRSTLERELERLSPPRIPFDQLARRRDRKRRDQRIRAGMLGLAIVLVMGWLGLSAIRSAPPLPADDPTPTRLGIFADVRGWLTYGDVADYFDGATGIWAVDPANPDEPPVLLNRGPGLPLGWSSDGSKLLINRGAPTFDSPDSLVVLNSDGSETQVAHANRITGGSFTPDGSKVVYGATLPGKELKTGIFVVDAEGGTPQLIYAAPRRRIDREGYPPDTFQLAVSSPTLSPDGSRIAYVEGMGDWGNGLWVMNADGTDRHRIVGEDEAGLWTGSLQWSPDGTRLAFEAGGWVGGPDTVDLGIYVVNTDGSALTLVAKGSARAPYWSPDGSRIAFQRSDRASGALSDGTLYTMVPDGRSDVQSLGHELEPGVLLGAWNPLFPQA